MASTSPGKKKYQSNESEVHSAPKTAIDQQTPLIAHLKSCAEPEGHNLVFVYLAPDVQHTENHCSHQYLEKRNPRSCESFTCIQARRVQKLRATIFFSSNQLEPFRFLKKRFENNICWRFWTQMPRAGGLRGAKSPFAKSRQIPTRSSNMKPSILQNRQGTKHCLLRWCFDVCFHSQRSELILVMHRFNGIKTDIARLFSAVSAATIFWSLRTPVQCFGAVEWTARQLPVFTSHCFGLFRNTTQNFENKEPRLRIVQGYNQAYPVENEHEEIVRGSPIEHSCKRYKKALNGCNLLSFVAFLCSGRTPHIYLFQVALNTSRGSTNSLDTWILSTVWWESKITLRLDARSVEIKFGSG